MMGHYMGTQLPIFYQYICSTLNNPADMSDVIGVGGIDDNDQIAPFSSRGVTTREFAHGGYGKTKPDLVTYGYRVRGTAIAGDCNILSGTSVASPIIAGAVTLLASVVPENKRWEILNPASMKQILHESAQVLPQANMYEQGAGKFNLLKAFELIQQYKPKVTFFPSKLDFTSCPYMWPFCAQSLYYGAMPVTVNVTVLNGMGVTGRVTAPPKWIPGSNGQMLKISFSHTRVLWPWSGSLAVQIEVSQMGRLFQGIAEGSIELTVFSPPGAGETQPRIMTAKLDLRIPIITPPLRQQRILWDQYHNIQYPPGYIPRDNLNNKEDILDWNGDHPHTNFRDLFIHLRNKGYYLELLNKDLTQFDARQYGTLLIVDPEEEYTMAERSKLQMDVEKKGLSVIVFADWYDTDVMKKIKFLDDNTHTTWTTVTGYVNNLLFITILVAPMCLHSMRCLNHFKLHWVVKFMMVK